MTATIATLLAAHAAGKPVTATIEETYDRIVAHDDPALFIAIRPKAEALAIAARLEASGSAGKSLYGVPFVVKDNIDVAGLPTTAACPAFAYRPDRSAFVVDRLERAGAIVIGKTNLDQFATGLVGVRSPYGVPRNALRPDLIPGGSSSGSATAVGAGLVPFSLGTDTAGSGRVPAALNGIVGLKAVARRSLHLRRRSRLPHARHHLDLRRAMSPTPSWRFARRSRSTNGTLTAARSASPLFQRSRAGFGLAFRARISFSSSTTRTPRPPSRKMFGSLSRSAPASSSSTSSPSPRSPACSTTGRGSPSAMPRPSR